MLFMKLICTNFKGSMAKDRFTTSTFWMVDYKMYFLCYIYKWTLALLTADTSIMLDLPF